MVSTCVEERFQLVSYADGHNVDVLPCCCCCCCGYILTTSVAWKALLPAVLDCYCCLRTTAGLQPQPLLLLLLLLL